MDSRSDLRACGRAGYRARAERRLGALGLNRWARWLARGLNALDRSARAAHLWEAGKLDCELHPYQPRVTDASHHDGWRPDVCPCQRHLCGFDTFELVLDGSGRCPVCERQWSRDEMEMCPTCRDESVESWGIPRTLTYAHPDVPEPSDAALVVYGLYGQLNTDAAGRPLVSETERLFDVLGIFEEHQREMFRSWFHTLTIANADETSRAQEEAMKPAKKDAKA